MKLLLIKLLKINQPYHKHTIYEGTGSIRDISLSMIINNTIVLDICITYSVIFDNQY